MAHKESVRFWVLGNFPTLRPIMAQFAWELTKQEQEKYFAFSAFLLCFFCVWEYERHRRSKEKTDD